MLEIGYKAFSMNCLFLWWYFEQKCHFSLLDDCVLLKDTPGRVSSLPSIFVVLLAAVTSTVSFKPPDKFNRTGVFALFFFYINQLEKAMYLRSVYRKFGFTSKFLSEIWPATFHSLHHTFHWRTLSMFVHVKRFNVKVYQKLKKNL